MAGDSNVRVLAGMNTRVPCLIYDRRYTPSAIAGGMNA